MPSLRKHGSVWYLYYRENGKQIGVSLHTKYKQEAEAKAREILNTGTEKDIHLTALLRYWVQTNQREKSEAYVNSVQHVVMYFIAWHKDAFVNSVNPTLVNSYKHYLFENGYVKETPFHYTVSVLKGNKRIDFLSKEEIKRFLSVISDPLDKAYMEFLLSTGCRRGEFYNLQWDDITDQYIKFTGKTGQRLFPVQDNIRTILNTTKQLQKPGMYVYNKRKGDNSDKSALSKKVKQYFRPANLSESYTLHTLRHTFASHMAMNGVPIYTIFRRLGHRNISTTERYSHLKPEHINIPLTLFHNHRQFLLS